MLSQFLHCLCEFLGALCAILYAGLRIGFAPGLMLGVLFGPGRVSGVDFRQWFWDPTQNSEVKDDSWIGLMRGAASYMFAGAALSLLFAAVWQWFCASCRLGAIDGILSFIADCLVSWLRWPDLFGVLVGFAVAQLIVELAWWCGLRWVPFWPVGARATLRRSPAGARVATGRPQGRRLVICCDGTWNWPQPDRETNVVRLLRAINPRAPMQPGPGNVAPVTQIAYYHLGVGTGNILDRIVGGGAGVGLSNSVKTCYGFLVDNYLPGDEILLFGFSRGAYVARSLAGLVGYIGIMQKYEMVRFYEMWDWYTTRDGRDISDLDKFIGDRHRPEDVIIQCIGVWDTVGALGIPGTRFCAQSYTFHQTELGKYVRHAFQALAIDEHRGNFQASPWVPVKGSKQVFEQVWFPGVHSNIGGGYDNHGLSDTTLLWMVSQLVEYQLLDLDLSCIRAALDQRTPYPTGKLEESRTFVWKLLGCTVPRPVGTTSTAEKIHQSAYDYKQGIYRGSRRQTWLDRRLNHMPTFYRTPFETANAVTHVGPSTPLPQLVSKRLGWCDWIMQQLAGSA